jgi:hypothetical protein
VLVTGQVTIDGYRDADGTAHEVLVGRTADGRWQVVDASDAGERVVDTLDGYDDDRPQAEAVARDYLSMISDPAGPREAIAVSRYVGEG